MLPIASTLRSTQIIYKEEVCMKFLQVVKGKLFVAVLAGVVLVGGATAAFAATQAGRDTAHLVTHSQSDASKADKASHKNNGHTTNSHSNRSEEHTSELQSQFHLVC